MANTHARNAHCLEHHGHTEGLLFCLDRGMIKVETPRRTTLVTPGQLGWIGPGVVHQATWFGVAGGQFVYVSASLCPGRLPPHQVTTLGMVSQAAMASLHKHQEQQLQSEEWDYMQHLLHVIFYDLKQPSHSPMNLQMPNTRALLHLAHHLLEHPDDDQTAQQWADRLHLSVSTMLRRFNSETGVSFVRWRQQLRMLKALEMLRVGEPVTHIAMAVGYQNVSSFTKIFQQYFHTAPSRYFSHPDQ